MREGIREDIRIEEKKNERIVVCYQCDGADLSVGADWLFSEADWIFVRLACLVAEQVGIPSVFAGDALFECL